MPATRSLALRDHPLASPVHQRDLLSFGVTFEDVLTRYSQPALATERVEVLQINVGKLCNQACRHCHVDAGPDRRELMTRR